ncbi:MAG: GAF domain-containing protein [candidate division Zixibacteria bacterium]|nr:GAF domain-containing protein [candidate division Zixibacteria bacterium]
MDNYSRKLQASGVRKQLSDKLEMVVRIARVLDGATEECFREALKLTVQTIACDAATLYLVKAGVEDMDEIASVGKRVEPSDYGSEPEFAADQPVWADHPEKPSLLTRSKMGETPGQDSGYALVLRAPLLVQDRLYGVLNLGYCHPVPPDEEDVKVATVIASLLSPIVERFQYRQEVKSEGSSMSDGQSNKNRNLLHSAIMQNLAEAAELGVTVNHKLNNELSVIIGNVQYLLLERGTIDKKSLDRLGRIETAAIRVGMASQKLLRIHWLATRGCPQPQDE